MDWLNRWFCCCKCRKYFRTPKAFLDHKKDGCSTKPATFKVPKLKRLKRTAPRSAPASKNAENAAVNLKQSNCGQDDMDVDRCEHEIQQSRRAIEETEIPPIGENKLTDNLPETGEDWRQNADVIEAICERLPLKDLKAVRLVCKLWAVAGAVPLAHKSVVRKRDYDDSRSLDLDAVEKYLRFEDNKIMSTGFRLRHVKLIWSHVYGSHNLNPNDLSLVSRWFQVLRSNAFKLIISLKFVGCSPVVIKLLLSYFLPTYWNKLESLKFTNIKNGLSGQLEIQVNNPALELPVEVPPTLPRFELQDFGLDDLTTANYNLEFLSKCPKLKSLTIRSHEYSTQTPGHKEWQQNTQKSYNQITAALVDKKLTSLDLGHFPSGHSQNQLSPSTLLWKSFQYHLITSNQATLKHLSLLVHVETPAGIKQFFDDLLPLDVQKRLRSFSVTCKTPRNNDAVERGSLFYEAISLFHTKGYLRVPDFRFFCSEGYDRQISFILKERMVLAIQLFSRFNLEPHFPAGFVDIMEEVLPDINYVCSPRQTKRRFGSCDAHEPWTTTTTTLLERIGKQGVFDLPLVDAEWDSLEPVPSQVLKTQLNCFRTKCCKLPDLEPIRNNTNFDLKVKWEEYDLTCSRARYSFGTVQNLAEAWANIQNSVPSWSSIPVGFVPEVVETGEGSYAIARIFEQIIGTRPCYGPETGVRTRRARNRDGDK